mmetsp:Transcript_92727/g.283904  ORF Transcript_92727/g.283904 Transcript_92727/m.283904 type:complete len:230 (+) Transcript_92727:483-1172(+)
MPQPRPEPRAGPTCRDDRPAQRLHRRGQARRRGFRRGRRVPRPPWRHPERHAGGAAVPHAAVVRRGAAPRGHARRHRQAPRNDREADVARDCRQQAGVLLGDGRHDDGALGPDGPGCELAGCRRAFAAVRQPAALPRRPGGAHADVRRAAGRGVRRDAAGGPQRAAGAGGDGLQGPPLLAGARGGAEGAWLAAFAGGPRRRQREAHRQPIHLGRLARRGHEFAHGPPPR